MGERRGQFFGAQNDTFTALSACAECCGLSPNGGLVPVVDVLTGGSGGLACEVQLFCAVASYYKLPVLVILCYKCLLSVFCAALCYWQVATAAVWPLIRSMRVPYTIMGLVREFATRTTCRKFAFNAARFFTQKLIAHGPLCERASRYRNLYTHYALQAHCSKLALKYAI